MVDLSYLGGCRWHLVYACGAASNLPELEARQAAAQALLLILSQVGVEEEGDVVEGILPDSVGVLEPPAVSDQQVPRSQVPWFLAHPARGLSVLYVTALHPSERSAGRTFLRSINVISFNNRQT